MLEAVEPDTFESAKGRRSELVLRLPRREEKELGLKGQHNSDEFVST